MSSNPLALLLFKDPKASLNSFKVSSVSESIYLFFSLWLRYSVKHFASWGIFLID